MKFFLSGLLIYLSVTACKTKAPANNEYIMTGYYSMDEIKNLDWFKEGFNKYTPDMQVINQLKQVNKNDFIMIFGGNWCSDSRDLLPKYFKTAELAGINNHQVYFLDRSKTSPDKLEETYLIELVPTFIILKDGVETGRIVESVNVNIETDLLEIINK